MRGHGKETGVHNPSFTFLDLIDSGLHVVVDPAPGDTTEDLEGACVCIK